MSAYYVIQQNKSDSHVNGADVAGPFKTIESAKKFLIYQCVRLCENQGDGSEFQEPEKWALPSRIVKLVETVRQEPVLNISAKLVKV